MKKILLLCLLLIAVCMNSAAWFKSPIIFTSNAKEGNDINSRIYTDHHNGHNLNAYRLLMSDGKSSIDSFIAKDDDSICSFFIMMTYGLSMNNHDLMMQGWNSLWGREDVPLYIQIMMPIIAGRFYSRTNEVNIVSQILKDCSSQLREYGKEDRWFDSVRVVFYDQLLYHDDAFSPLRNLSYIEFPHYPVIHEAKTSITIGENGLIRLYSSYHSDECKIAINFDDNFNLVSKSYIDRMNIKIKNYNNGLDSITNYMLASIPSITFWDNFNFRHLPAVVHDSLTLGEDITLGSSFLGNTKLKLDFDNMHAVFYPTAIQDTIYPDEQNLLFNSKNELYLEAMIDSVPMQLKIKQSSREEIVLCGEVAKNIISSGKYTIVKSKKTMPTDNGDSDVYDIAGTLNLNIDGVTVGVNVSLMPDYIPEDDIISSTGSIGLDAMLKFGSLTFDIWSMKLSATPSSNSIKWQ